MYPTHKSESLPLISKLIALAMMILSLLALLLAPLLMPSDYSWLRHTTSESGAQGIPGAWLARMGFLLFGLAVAWMSTRAQLGWSSLGRVLHGIFGVFLIATAAFSTRPWMPGSPFDPVEDALHSFAATAMGFAFAIGVVIVFFRHRSDMLGRALDLVAIVAAVTIPLGMSALPDWTGLLQRAMFTIAYIWYSAEFLR